MTLILCLGNRDQVIQLSDRRLSDNGKLVDDEVNKSGILICQNGKFAYGFTGIARISTNKFETSTWLNSLIYECCPPDYIAQNILSRLRDRINSEFILSSYFLNVPLKNMGLSISFTGYIVNFSPPRLVSAVISNTIGQNEVMRNFNISTETEIRPNDDNFTYIQRIGNYLAMTQNDEDILRSMLLDHKPAHAIINKAVSIIQEMADRPKAKNNIGKQISSIIIKRDQNEVITNYHTSIIKSETYLPDQIIATNDENHFAMYGGTLVQPEHIPFVYPKWPKNRLCYCGSNLKYKYCHGKNIK
jgi:hypothetical protein